jgi:uncharacterized protein (TIGR02285 family)
MMACAGARGLAAFALFLMAWLPHAWAGDSYSGPDITWYSADIPPLFIFSGPLEGTGYGDVLLNLVAGTQVKRAPVSRIWYEIEHHPVTCSTGAIKTPARESYALFSAKPAMVPNYQVIVRAEFAAKLAPYVTDTGHIDLARLSQQSELIGGFITSRVYPGVLGEALSSDHAWRMEKLSETPLLMNLLRNNRIAFLFLSPVELAFYRQILGEDDRWVGIPIDGLPSHVEVYTACSKTDAGAQMIAQVDKILASDEQWARVTSVLSSWEARAQLGRFTAVAGSGPAHLNR